ncbi:MAG: FAD-dependent monooxygenase, partial [Alphaproteobacteria bacterium]|nr:FAD-dependent monooxygenase [Alphaproteobacteria bacterium]
MSAEPRVLIAGAGPTGQALSLALSAMGVPHRLIDALPERTPHSRALVLQARSLELLSAYGLAEGLLREGQTGVEARIYVNRELAALVPLSDFAIGDTAYPFPLVVSQERTEAALDAGLAARGVTVERPVRLVDFSQDAEGVHARLEHADGREEALRVQWLVGCDGAHSVVRKGAGLSFEGAAYPQDFMLADVHVDWELPDDRVCVFLRSGGTLAVLPFKEPGLVRLIATRASEATADQEPTLEEFEAIFREAVPGEVRLHDPVWVSRFRLHHRGVDRYRAGRVFVAGDAAHIHSPAGGQGMNTGIQDALNLGWKLGLVCLGEADEALLESYDAERAPVGRRLLGWTDRAFSLASSDNVLIAAARSLLVPWLAPKLTADPARRARVYRFVSQLSIRYRESPLALAWEGPRPEGFSQGPAPGDRGPGGALFDPA